MVRRNRELQSTPRADVSLDAFLELKLENERLREELRELKLDLGEYDDFRKPRRHLRRRSTSQHPGSRSLNHP